MDETIAGLQVHPAALLFPPMSEEEFRGLVDDIRQHGLQHPILVTPAQQILDGRHRARACVVLGRHVSRQVVYGDPVALVISYNLHRRHLTPSQRAMIAAKIATLGVGDNRGAHRPSEGSAALQTLTGISQADAAAQLHVSPHLVSEAARVRREAPEAVVREIEAGRETIGGATRRATVEVFQPGEAMPAEKPATPGILDQLFRLLDRTARAFERFDDSDFYLPQLLRDYPEAERFTLIRGAASAAVRWRDLGQALTEAWQEETGLPVIPARDAAPGQTSHTAIQLSAALAELYRQLAEMPQHRQHATLFTHLAQLLDEMAVQVEVDLSSVDLTPAAPAPTTGA